MHVSSSMAIGAEMRRKDLSDSRQLLEVARGYQLALLKDRSDPGALVGISLVALASRQHEASIQTAKAAVAVAPAMDLAWVTLGQAVKAAGRCEEAKQAYLEAIRLDSASPPWADWFGRITDG